MCRDYKSAVDDLNNLQSNASILQQIVKDKAVLFGQSIPEMIEYLDLLGYKVNQLNSLNIIHITGTKGKGSASAFCHSILSNFNQSQIKTGLFTSPHMIEVRERIRIDGQPLSAQKFADYFYYCYDRLVGHKINAPRLNLPGPSYFRFLNLMAFHVFIQERVEAAILEVGIGGEYDSTNVVTEPVVCGISHLGLDHTSLLGDTIKEVAWHKAGIIKSLVPIITIPNQVPEAQGVIASRANKKQAPLTYAKPLNEYLNFHDVRLGLGGKHQFENASLAVSLCEAWLHKKKNMSVLQNTIPDFMLRGLRATNWPGRSYIYKDVYGGSWFLDGAHTSESIWACVDWFTSARDQEKKNYLIFNPASGRNADMLLEALCSGLRKNNIPIEGVAFCPNIIYPPANAQSNDSVNFNVDQDLSLAPQKKLAQMWQELNPSSKPNISIHPSIQQAVHWIQSLNKDSTAPNQTLVTGSLHLVGGVMAALNHAVV
ncbi:Folylpolyglutamate synthetase [Entomophthora muscae]|uniref:Folylpolyglutamate synthetase n=1 Tax=Entomophthora muscae TaxID=34485 RepID=A0ACC2RKG3_9FUNG|nr:Folylpolyglutamate synthetase [Entomophthora muscae]